MQRVGNPKDPREVVVKPCNALVVHFKGSCSETVQIGLDWPIIRQTSGMTESGLLEQCNME